MFVEDGTAAFATFAIISPFYLPRILLKSYNNKNAIS